jgi:hypothetical protein
MLLHSTPPHSHSIVLRHGNALIFQRKFFPRMTKNRLADPSEICALDLKHKISTIGDLLGFSDYRHRLVDFQICD